jgi:hypothetical protein
MIHGSGVGRISGIDDQGPQDSEALTLRNRVGQAMSIVVGTGECAGTDVATEWVIGRPELTAIALSGQ